MKKTKTYTGYYNISIHNKVGDNLNNLYDMKAMFNHKTLQDAFDYYQECYKNFTGDTFHHIVYVEKSIVVKTFSITTLKRYFNLKEIDAWYFYNQW